MRVHLGGAPWQGTFRRSHPPRSKGLYYCPRRRRRRRGDWAQLPLNGEYSDAISVGRGLRHASANVPLGVFKFDCRCWRLPVLGYKSDLRYHHHDRAIVLQPASTAGLGAPWVRFLSRTPSRAHAGDRTLIKVPSPKVPPVLVVGPVLCRWQWQLKRSPLASHGVPRVRAQLTSRVPAFTRRLTSL
jgi:hypothetical protein